MDEWFKKHEEAVAKQLVAHGLLGSAQWHYRSWTADVPVESIPPESRDWWQQNYPATIFRKDVKDEVRQRFLADVERSKQLTLAYRDLEKGRLEKQRENITEGIRRIKNEAFGLAVPAMAKEPQYMDFLRALPYSAIRRQAPKVEATFYKTAVSHKDAQGKAGEPLREALHISVGCDIVADTTLYLPFSDKEPYKVESAVLKADEALPDDLMPEARAEIQKLKSEHAQPLRDGNGLIAVASVYCAGVADLAGALKATYEGLPAMDKQGQRGKILFAQQVAFIPVETLKVRVDPVRVLVTDQAGAPLGDIPDLVKIAGQPAKPSKEEYWGVHEFTTYQEKIPIEAAYTMPDGTVVEGRAEFSVDDVENWQDPQPPKEPITIRLPIYKAGTLKVAGRVNAQPPPDAPYPESAVVFNKALEVSTGVHLPGGDNGARNVKEWLVGMVGDAIAGAFDQVAERPQDGTFEATLRAPIRAGTPIKLTALGATFRDDFQGEVTVDPPAGPGTINVGTITLRAITQTVTVPGWDRPIPAKDYLAKLGEVGLRGKPQLGDPAPEATRAFTVQEASPAPGTQVRRGTEVVVTAHGDYAREVPDVRDQPAQAAVRMMTDAGFKTTQELGPAAESENRQYTVASQSVAPGTKHRPDQPVHLVLRGPFVAGRKMPRLVGLTQDQAREALETAGIKAVLEVVDRQQPPDDPAKADTIYKQEPAEKADVGTQETVRLWLFAGRGAPPGRPYYAAFRLVWPKLKEGIQSPKRGEGESQQAYKERKRRFYEGLNESNFDWVPQPDDKNLLIFHVSNEALAMYPREGFVSGQPYAIGIDGQTKDKDGQTQSFRGALLLTSAGTVETMEQLLETFPALRAKEKLEAMAFTKRDGTMARSDEKGTWLLGPIRAGWSSQDRQLAMRLMVAILSAFDCFIATTVYDSPVAEPVEVLRGFRDEVLLASPAGWRLVEWYYLYGPRMATAVMKEPRLARPTRAALDVLVWVLKHTDTRSGRVRWLIDLGLAPIEQVLRAVLPPADSMMDEFGRDLIRTRFLDGPATDPPEPTAAPPAPKEGEPE